MDIIVVLRGYLLNYDRLEDELHKVAFQGTIKAYGNVIGFKYREESVASNETFDEYVERLNIGIDQLNRELSAKRFEQFIERSES